ncbi:Dolichyl-diphosphooligosaccharide-protein glycosyltransferase 48kDa subunit [Tilletiaria anomala UBC 951]|uniref:Dolichyl-diphosphooligosaccharide--protein glycosyltransferase subunit WBP1 n=1 Tax=Tilletiaria anomala (strain ATCC 24038 / CBS 436.72 / UBC 951) TaxID=1037660 RepID=A0A066WA87_TILAU|nr:Dolichyl-diphosphooligosaccharide-protein glycosyltransferase 48kDa subunit [Tilletiaria anomala UBC 951]KDN47994.1 Dolichyl-diphosphooligosaccharide-protein glycosyltransferase 48kDa subunit [Tilletiaria anomala UBC 951]
MLPMRLPALLAALLLFCSVLVSAASSSLSSSSPSAVGVRTLVVLKDAEADRAAYSKLFDRLREKGYQLTFRSAKAATPQLSTYELNDFDHLFYWTPSTAPSATSDLSPQKIVEFMRRGGNLIFGLDSDVTEGNRDFAREFHLDVEPRGTGLIDHFRTETKLDTGNHTAILVGGGSRSTSQSKLSPGGAVLNAHVFSSETLEQLKTSPILFRGVAHRIGALPLAFPLLHAPATSYSTEGPPSEDKSAVPLEENLDILTGGQVASLVSAFQIKENSARALFLGSLDMLKNSFIDAKDLRAADGARYASTANLAFATDALGWAMQEHSVLRVASTSHHRVRLNEKDTRPEYEESEDAQAVYRVKDLVTFHIDLAQHLPMGGWQPAPSDLDLQVSLVMLDPYVTTKLSAAAPQTIVSSGQTQTNATTRYSASFRMPDRHGVFTFHVDWKRQGWSYIKTRDTAPVRPFNHDEHPRFLSAAYPYVSGAFSTMTAFVIFCTLWLVVKEPKQKQKKQ